MAFTFNGPFGGHALYECRDGEPCLQGDTRWLMEYAERRTAGMQRGIERRSHAEDAGAARPAWDVRSVAARTMVLADI